MQEHFSALAADGPNSPTPALHAYLLMYPSGLMVTFKLQIPETFVDSGSSTTPVDCVE